MKKYLFVILIITSCSTLIFAQFKTDIELVRKCIDSTKLQVNITKENKSYYTNDQSKIQNILEIFNSLQGLDVVGHYHPDENYWTITFTELGSDKIIKTIHYNDSWNSFMYANQHFGMTNEDFNTKILVPLKEYEKLIYTCKSLKHYRKCIDHLYKKQNRKLYLENSFNEIENLYYKNDDWGFYNFEIENIEFVSYQTLTDSIQNEVRKSVQTNDVKIIFNYPQLVGELSMEERNAKKEKDRLENPRKYKPIPGGKAVGRPQYGISSSIMGRDVKQAVLVNFSAECSSEIAKKIQIGNKKSEWQKLHEPNLTLVIFTNKKEKLLKILDSLR